jgi:hypothetical protein
MLIADLIFDNFWVFLILGTIFNAFLLKARSKRIIAKQPDLKEGYDKLFKGYLVYLNVPWMVMGIGMVFGGVPSFFSFSTPRDGNPFVLAFHATLISLWIIGAWWLFFKRGNEFLAKYPGVLGPAIQSPALIKIFTGFILLGGALIMISIWNR